MATGAETALPIILDFVRMGTLDDKRAIAALTGNPARAFGLPGGHTMNGQTTVVAGRVFIGSDIGWVYSLDAVTGKQLWRKRVEDHEATRLTGSPVEHDGVVYIPAASWEETRSLDPQYVCCTFRGSITALRVRDDVAAYIRDH